MSLARTQSATRPRASWRMSTGIGLAGMRALGCRSAVLDQLLHREVPQPVPVPPLRLDVAPMPLEEERQEVAGPFMLGATVGIGRDALLQRLDPASGRLLAFREHGRRVLGRDRRARQIPAARQTLLPPLLQPAAQQPGRDAVVAVVVGEILQVSRIAIARPGLVLDDAEARLGDRALALGHVELLDALDRVRLDRGPDPLPHDLVEVHEHLAAQDPVDFVLTGRVALHEPLDGARLVAGVVVDVHRRVTLEALDDEVDEGLEGPLLTLAVVAPDGSVGRLGRLDGDDAKEVFEAFFQCPGVGLDVKEEVVRGWLGQERQALARLVGVGLDELVEQLARVGALDLEAGRVAGPRQPAGVHVSDRAIRRQGGERAHRRHAVDGEPLRVRPRHAGHDREVVVAPTAVHAGREPGADAAVIHGIRISAGRQGVAPRGCPVAEDDGFETALYHPVVGGVVVEPHRVGRAVAGDDVDAFRRDALELRQPVRVDADLEQGAALDGARELRVGDLVAPGPQGRTGAVDLQQEVGVAQPAPVEEGGLEDDVGAVAHRLDGGCLGGPERLRRALRPFELDDRPALGATALEEGALMRLAALLEQLQLRVLPVGRLLPEVVGAAELERGEVIAGQEADEVGGADDERAVLVALQEPAVPLLRPGRARVSGDRTPTVPVRAGAPRDAPGARGPMRPARWRGWPPARRRRRRPRRRRRWRPGARFRSWRDARVRPCQLAWHAPGTLPPGG